MKIEIIEESVTATMSPIRQEYSEMRDGRASDRLADLRVSVLQSSKLLKLPEDFGSRRHQRNGIDFRVGDH